MSFGFSISGTSKEKDILASRGDLGKLIKGQALAVGGSDSVSGFGSEPEGSNSESLGNVEKSGIIGDATNNGNYSTIELSFSFSWLSGVLGQNSSDSRDGDGVSI